MSENGLAHRTALVVLGAHRSGTSAMARVLGLSGGRLPNDPHPAGPDNERGFWESRSVIALDEEMLEASDSRWDDIFSGQPRHHLSNFDRVFRQRAGEVLDAVFEGADPIVLKDPRINALAAFWNAALRDHGYEPLYVVMVRNPAEVAASMLARNSMPTDQGLLLWLDQMLAAERDTRQDRRLFVAYDDLLEDWRTCLDRTERTWGRPLPRRTSAAGNAIEQFLTPTLRHYRASERSLQGNSPVRRMAAEAYEWFRVACQAEGMVDGEALDGLRERLGTLRETIEPLLADQRTRLAEYAKHTAALEAHRTQALAGMEIARGREELLQQELARVAASANADQSALAERLASAEQREQELTRLLASSEEREASLAAELEETRGQLDRSVAEAAELHEALNAGQAREAALDGLKAELDRHHEESASKDQLLDRLRRELAESQDAQAVGERTAEELRQALAHELSQASAADVEGELKLIESRYGVLSEELRRVQATAEHALSRNRTLAARLEAETEANAAQARAAEEAWLAERERMAAEPDGLRKRHAQDLDALRDQHARHLDEGKRQFAATEQALTMRLEDLNISRSNIELEVQNLRAERAQILGSTSWRLAALPRRLISNFRRG